MYVEKFGLDPQQLQYYQLGWMNIACSPWSMSGDLVKQNKITFIVRTTYRDTYRNSIAGKLNTQWGSSWGSNWFSYEFLTEWNELN